MTAGAGRDKTQQGDVPSSAQTQEPRQLAPREAWKLEWPVLAVPCGRGCPGNSSLGKEALCGPRKSGRFRQPEGSLLAAFPTAGASPTLKRDLGSP